MLYTDRAVLKPFSAEHIPNIMGMFHEPESNRFIKPLLGKSDDFYLEKLAANLTKNKQMLQYWSVYHAASNDFVGTLNLNEFEGQRIVQLGLHLTRKFWNQGYGFELCVPLLKYGFEERKLSAIHWVIESEHNVSRKLANKLGFKPYDVFDDDGCPLEIFKLGKEEWQNHISNSYK